MAKVYMELSEFKPWSGAEDAWDKIVDAGMLDEFAALLDATFPSEGGDHECYIDETELNDMLRFEAEEWLGYLGLSDDDGIEESTRIRGRRVTSSSRRSSGRRVMAARNEKTAIRAARVPKQITEYVLQGNYGYGWDDLTYHDSYQSAKADEADYRANENIPLRIIERKVDNPNYSAASDPMYTNLAKKYGSGIKNIIGNDNLLISRRTYIIETEAIDELGGIDDAIYYVIHNPRKLEDYRYAMDGSPKVEDIEWQEYLDDIREASRKKWDVVSEDTTFGNVPVLVMFNTRTRFSMRDAVYFAAYDV